MKKALLLLASAALLLVGCAKEKFAEPSDGGLTNVTISANIDGGVATKAFADGDGAGAYVNRCIMEIYFQDQLYKRMEAAMSGTPATATFANVPVVAGKEYQILFWADCGGAEKADLYYTTTSLKAVTVAKTAFIDALKAGDNDKLDAFCFGGNYTVPQNPTQHYNVSLKRPFAQLNVITTDVAAGKTVFKEGLLPEKVSVSYEAANTINVATGEISKVGNNAEDYTFTYEASVYGAWSTITAQHPELTLSMDYIFASTEKGNIDVTFVTKNGGQAVMTHNLTNLPYQRNYRTNVKGELLTTGGTWTATVDPIWNSPDIVKVVEVADIKSANKIIEQYAPSTKQLEVKFTGEPNDSGVPAGEAAGKRAIVTTPIQQDGSLSIEVLAQTRELYVGDYPDEYTVTSVDTENAKNAVVNINVPKSSSIVTLVINAPSKSVYINGKEVENVGTITNLDAITSQNTLIIEKDQTVNKLTIRQGGLEIHGTVGQAVVPEGHGTIVVRDCENLKEAEVYDVLKAYIAEGYVGVKGRTTADLWDIVPEVCKIDTKSYGTLIDAVAAVQSGETINLVRDYEGDGVVVPGGKNFTLDFGGHTYKVIGNMAGSAGTQNQCFQLLKGSTLVFQNGTITTSCAKLGINTYSDVTIKNVTIDMSQTEATGQVACLETCNGTVSVEGDSNLITKEDQIATLVLYWPNGGYGDINLTMNTTGEVNGLMAYGSYQVQDLSTVAQHSHVAIKNGKYDCTFDMDGLESYDYVISGGVFANKPDEFLVADKYEVTENTDVATKAQYPWTVGRKHVAMIGSTKYYTLADAVADVPTNGTQTTITMIDDHEILGNDGVTIAKTQNIILDLAGYTIKNLVNENKRSQVILNLGTLKIIDSVGDGLITNSAAEGAITGEWWSTPQYNYQTNVIYNYGGHLIIDGANLLETATSSICYAIDNNSNENDVTITIKSGHISAPSTAIRMFCNSTTKENVINVEGGLIEGGYAGIWTQLPGGVSAKKAIVNISGGTLKGDYAWYDYPYNGDLYDQIFVTITDGCFDGYTFTYGANIDISGGVFNNDVYIIQNIPSNISVTGGKFKADVIAYGNQGGQYVYPEYISGGLFTIDTFTQDNTTYGCYWTDALVDGKTYVELPESDPEYAEGYRFKVVDQSQQ